MAGVSIIYLFYLGFFIINLCSHFLLSFSTMLRFKSKVLFNKKQGILTNTFSSYSTSLLVLFTTMLNICTLRVPNYLWIIPWEFVILQYLFVLVIFFFLKSFWVYSGGYNNSENYDQLFSLIYICTLLLIISENLLSFILLVECVAALYYFFFLQTTPNNFLSITRYKNLLSLYLWLSFFTLFFFLVGSLCLINFYGTLNFKELLFFKISDNCTIFILISFLWKLGMPGFHFFKFEIYRYLPATELILFSFTSLFFNSLIFVTFIWLISTIFSSSYLLLFICLTTNILLLLSAGEKINLFIFFAFSSLNTLVFFLVIIFS